MKHSIIIRDVPQPVVGALEILFQGLDLSEEERSTVMKNIFLIGFQEFARMVQDELDKTAMSRSFQDHGNGSQEESA